MNRLTKSNRGLGMIEVMFVVLAALTITALTFYTAVSPRRAQRSEINDYDYNNLIHSLRRVIENPDFCRFAFKNAAYTSADPVNVNRGKMSHVDGAVPADQLTAQIYAGNYLLLQNNLRVGSLIASFALNRLSDGIGSPTVGRIRYPVSLVVTVNFGDNTIGPTTFSNAANPLTLTLEVDTTTWDIVDCVC